MKKYLVWIGAAVLVMALASPSMAQFKSWGHLEIFSYWENNKSFNKDANDANYQGVGMRYRFNLGYGDPKTVMAVLGFEANARGFGEGPTDAAPGSYASSGYPAGKPVSGNGSYVTMAGKGGVGDWGTDAIGLQVRHAYFDFTIPNTPLTMQVGLQSIIFGGFLGRFFMLKDVPAYVLNGNFAPHTISAFWWKGMKQNFYMDNDLDYYGLLYRLRQKMVNVEAWFVYGNDRRSITDTWAVTATPAAPANGQYPTTSTVYTYGLTETIAPRPYEQKPWWLGANVPMTFGNLKVEPTFIYLGGKYYDAVSSAAYTNADLSAYLADVMVSYRLGPGLGFLVEGFYATGHDGTKNTAQGATENGWMSPGVTSAGLVDGTENRNVFGQGWSVFYFWNTDLQGYYAAKQLTPAGHAFIRPNVEFNPLAWLNLNFNYVYIINTANKYNGHIAGITAAGPTGTDVNKSYIGSELNGIAKIAIYKDFVYTMGFGYFFPGDVYNTPTKSADNAWALLSNLKYVF
jgi:hypothetical protein